MPPPGNLLRELEKRSCLVILADCHYSIGRTDGFRLGKNHGTHQRGIQTRLFRHSIQQGIIVLARHLDHYLHVLNLCSQFHELNRNDRDMNVALERSPGAEDLQLQPLAH
jgi:hypothetical protein